MWHRQKTYNKHYMNNREPSLNLGIKVPEDSLTKVPMIGVKRTNVLNNDI
jgi:hypothetical protein